MSIIVDYEVYENSDRKVTYIWIDGQLPPDFDRHLLSELLALAEPVGLGVFEALGRKSENLGTILDKALQRAAFTHSGRRNLNDALVFGYVAGYRIKVEYLPFGFSIYEDSPDIHKRYPGMPVVVSSEFDDMYGEGALAGAIGLALAHRVA